MEHSEKIHVKIPAVEDLTTQIKIILQLAKINAYNLQGNLRDASGNWLESTNVVENVRACLKPHAAHDESFIGLLKQAKIDPKIILNPEIKNRLLGYSNAVYRPPPLEDGYSKVHETLIKSLKPKRKRQKWVKNVR